MQTIRDLATNIRLVGENADFSPASVFLVVLQLISIVCFSFVAPFVIRGFMSTPYVESTEPLEFVFHTCTDNLQGVCSFPEAEVNFNERELEFHGGYRYSFTLNVEFSELAIARAAGVFIGQIDVQDEKTHTIMILRKTIRVPGAGLYEWCINLRNFFFWPLHFVGFLGDGGVSQLRVEFPNEYREAFSRPARMGNTSWRLTYRLQPLVPGQEVEIKERNGGNRREKKTANSKLDCLLHGRVNRMVLVDFNNWRQRYLAVQIQNRFIQISRASLRISANVGFSTYIISHYPLLTYLFMSFICMGIFLVVFGVYWAGQGVQAYQRIVETEELKQKKQNSMNKHHYY